LSGAWVGALAPLPQLNTNPSDPRLQESRDVLRCDWEGTMDPISVDMTDPTVAALAWALTTGAGKIFNLTNKPHLRATLPVVAVLLAVGVRSGADLVSGGTFDFATLVRGVAAGAVAVVTHSQFRELFKMRQPDISAGEDI